MIDHPSQSILPALNNQRSISLQSPSQRNVSSMEWESNITQPTTSYAAMEIDQNDTYQQNPQV